VFFTNSKGCLVQCPITHCAQGVMAEEMIADHIGSGYHEATDVLTELEQQRISL
jgi:hypothetical protein